MAEDPETSLNELVFLRIPAGVLVSQERNNRLRHGHPANHEDGSPCCQFPLRTLARSEAGAETRVEIIHRAKRLSSNFQITFILSLIGFLDEPVLTVARVTARVANAGRYLSTLTSAIHGWDLPLPPRRESFP